MRTFNSVFTLARGINGWRFAMAALRLLVKCIVMTPFLMFVNAACFVAGAPSELLSETVSVARLVIYVMDILPFAMALSALVVGASELYSRCVKSIGSETSKEVSHGC